MMRSRLTCLPVFAILAVSFVQAQEPDLAAERARLANQRIQAEALRQAQDEATRATTASPSGATGAAAAPTPEPGAAPPPQAPPAGPASPPPEAAPAGAPDRSSETSQALQQLRDLGELRDAGYVTDEEFERIKRRILEERF